MSIRSRSFLARGHFDLIEEYVLVDEGVILSEGQLFESISS
jgi:hypothetical protein